MVMALENVLYADIQGQLLGLYLRVSSGAVDTLEEIESSLAPMTQQAVGSEKLEGLLGRYKELILLAYGSSPAGLEYKAGAVLKPSQPQVKLPIVVTSVNPFKRTEMQKLCFDKWSALGFEIYTVNHHSEVGALKALGILDHQIIEIDDEQTGLALHGKPMPRILSVIELCAVRFDRGLLLVNSDLYPAVNDTVFLETWQNVAPAVGLTRQDVQKLDYFVPASSAPYRQGLDAFYLGYDALHDVLAAARLYKASERMCFGIVGWDFFMGALLKTSFKGTFLDSGFLLHEKHQQTYSDVEEFAHYLTAMQAMGFGIGKDHILAASEMHSNIVATCSENMAHCLPADLAARPHDRPLPEICEAVFRQLETRAPTIIHVLGRDKVLGLLSFVHERPDLDISNVLEELPPSEMLRAFGHVLLILVMFIQLRSEGSSNLTSTYPAGNMHAEAVRIIRKNTTEDWPMRRFEIAKLFAIELSTYGVFSHKLMDFLALSCENESERALVTLVKEFVTGELKNAA